MRASLLLLALSCSPDRVKPDTDTAGIAGDTDTVDNPYTSLEGTVSLD